MKDLSVQFQKDQILPMPGFDQAPPILVASPSKEKVRHADNL